ncbi:MAG: hypothetical protein U0R50_13830 [Gaiellales bacterium]
MTAIVKDAIATVFTALAVVVLAANLAEWPVWLVGDSVRWAAGAVMLLGIGACSLGRPQRGRTDQLLGVIGVVCVGLFVVALATGSSQALVALVVADVVLWLAATARHFAHDHGAARLA